MMIRKKRKLALGDEAVKVHQKIAKKGMTTVYTYDRKLSARQEEKS